MKATQFSKLFDQLSDEELLDRIGNGGLTVEAQVAAENEALNRQLEFQSPAAQINAPAPSYEGDLMIVARDLTPTEANILCACLNAAGVPAETADTNLVQTYSLLSIAVGGASIRVPANFVVEAQEVIAAFKRGDFEIGDDFESDQSSS